MFSVDNHTAGHTFHVFLACCILGNIFNLRNIKMFVIVIYFIENKAIHAFFVSYQKLCFSCWNSSCYFSSIDDQTILLFPFCLMLSNVFVFVNNTEWFINVCFVTSLSDALFLPKKQQDKKKIKICRYNKTDFNSIFLYVLFIYLIMNIHW